MSLKLLEHELNVIFGDKSLYGFSTINHDLSMHTNCKCALVTLMPFFSMDYEYNSVEFYLMLGRLQNHHSAKMDQLKLFLNDKNIRYAIPPASPQDNDEYFAEFSYKWAAIHAGLGFIGKNDVFVHYRYAQRVRISCLLLDLDAPTFYGEILSKCEDCNECVQACPHHYISGKAWHINIKRDELIDYKKCAKKSNHEKEGQKYLCAKCVLSCKYPNCAK